MKEQLVKFETAKLAKEKGFDYECSDYHYLKKGTYSYKIQKIVNINIMFFYTADIFIGNYEDTLEHALIKALKLIE